MKSTTINSRKKISDIKNIITKYNQVYERAMIEKICQNNLEISKMITSKIENLIPKTAMTELGKTLKSYNTVYEFNIEKSALGNIAKYNDEINKRLKSTIENLNISTSFKEIGSTLKAYNKVYNEAIGNLNLSTTITELEKTLKLYENIDLKNIPTTEEEFEIYIKNEISIKKEKEIDNTLEMFYAIFPDTKERIESLKLKAFFR